MTGIEHRPADRLLRAVRAVRGGGERRPEPRADPLARDRRSRAGDGGQLRLPGGSLLVSRPAARSRAVRDAPRAHRLRRRRLTALGMAALTALGTAVALDPVWLDALVKLPVVLAFPCSRGCSAASTTACSRFSGFHTRAGSPSDAHPPRRQRREQRLQQREAAPQDRRRGRRRVRRDADATISQPEWEESPDWTAAYWTGGVPHTLARVDAARVGAPGPRPAAPAKGLVPRRLHHPARRRASAPAAAPRGARARGRGARGHRGVIAASSTLADSSPASARPGCTASSWGRVAELFPRYDVVQGYATHAVLPMVARNGAVGRVRARDDARAAVRGHRARPDARARLPARRPRRDHRPRRDRRRAPARA